MEDWEELLSNVSCKPLDYQKKLVYCIEYNNNEYELNVLLSLINTNDEELFEICVDSLREFINTDNKQLISKNETIINHINKLMSSTGKPTRKVYEDFLKKLNN